jgi:dTDP-L-rhamnose 4-epimerase
MKTEDYKKNIWDPKCPVCGGEIKYLKNNESHADPPNQYAISKYSQELISLKLGKIHGIPSCALRYSIVHGSRQSINNLYSGALRVFVLQMMQNRKILLFEDGKMLRDFVSVYDVARANVLVMESSKSDYEVFNVGGGKAYTIEELSEIVARKLATKVKPEYGSYRVGDIRHAVSSIKKIKDIGWKPKFGEDYAVNDFINWVKRHKKINNNVEATFKIMYKNGTLRK